MTKDSVIERLALLPSEIEKAEKAILEASTKVQTTKEELTSRETELLLDGTEVA